MKKKLTDLQIGEQGRVITIPETHHAYVTGMGLRLNKTITLSSKQPLKGPLVITVGNNTISLARNIADHIVIEV